MDLLSRDKIIVKHLHYLIYKKSTQLENVEELLFWSSLPVLSYDTSMELWTKSYPTMTKNSMFWV